MLRAVIIDDDSRDREVLAMLLDKYCADDVFVAGHADNIGKARELIIETKPDLLFLDVELCNKTGFDLLSMFSSFNFRVIFITAYDRYAIRAIRFNALDYVLKPVVITELLSAVQKMKNTERVSVDAELKNLIYNLSHPRQKRNRVAIPVLNGYKMVAVEDIQYCEAKKEYTSIHCISQPAVLSSINLGEYEEMLLEYNFCRVHHSFLVNRDHVIQYVKGEGGELVISKDIMIPVSRRKKQEVMEWLTS